MADKVICWDLEGTIGDFQGIYYELTKDKLYKDSRNGLRHGIKGLLQQLKSEGFRQFVTTYANLEYATEALKRSELSEFFEKVYAGNIVKSYSGKKYGAVIESVGFSPLDVSANMIVIGNSEQDRPVDVEDLVFLHHFRAVEYDAIVAERILKHILKKGNGNFKAGFDACPKECNIGKGITFETEVGYNKCHMIENINAETYRRALVEF